MVNSGKVICEFNGLNLTDRIDGGGNQFFARIEFFQAVHFPIILIAIFRIRKLNCFVSSVSISQFYVLFLINRNAVDYRRLGKETG